MLHNIIMYLKVFNILKQQNMFISDFFCYKRNKKINGIMKTVMYKNHDLKLMFALVSRKQSKVNVT